jgi:hypothetical protein
MAWHRRAKAKGGRIPGAVWQLGSVDSGGMAGVPVCVCLLALALGTDGCGTCWSLWATCAVLASSLLPPGPVLLFSSVVLLCV